MLTITESIQGVLTTLHSIDLNDDNSLNESVRVIRDEVLENGDSALKSYAQRFDQVDVDFDILVSKDEIKDAYNKVNDSFIEAIQHAQKNVTAFHTHQRPESWQKDVGAGIQYGMQYRPLNSAGLYVPGGRANYPSTVVMNVVPAKIAGVPDLVILTPPQADGTISPEVLVAADVCGVDKIVRSGGAQAVFAAAYGTQSVPKVDKIVGPGNKYVTAAKNMVYGVVDIDKPAGPSEVLVYITDDRYADYAASELLAQLEHDPDARAVAVSESRLVLEKINDSFQTLLESCDRKQIIQHSQKNCYLVLTDSEESSIDAINKVASEHLVLLLDDYQSILNSINHAGSIFCGPYTPVALGDYWAGPNHVLPTAGAARFSSPLNVMDFMKFSAVLAYDKDSLNKVSKSIKTLTEVEGFDAHYKSIDVRLK